MSEPTSSVSPPPSHVSVVSFPSMRIVKHSEFKIESDDKFSGCTLPSFTVCTNPECKLENCTHELIEIIDLVVDVSHADKANGKEMIGESYEGGDCSEDDEGEDCSGSEDNDDEEDPDHYFPCREFAALNFSGVDYPSLCLELEEQTSSDEEVSEGSDPYLSAEEGPEE